MSHFSLKGSFHTYVYSQEGELKDESRFDNFITSSGLTQIYSLPVADCFKYLSVGTGTAINSVETTGLDRPVSSFSYLNSYVSNSNGYVETPSGVALYRAWLLSGAPVNVAGGFTGLELMVSPGNASQTLTSGAFSRVTGSFHIPSGDYAVVTYKLNVTVPTGVSYFEYIIANTPNTDPSITVCEFWDKLSGRYSLVHHGLKLITEDGQTITTTNGGSYLEPSEPASNIKAYLSTDNRQFLVNPNGGKAPNGYSGNYNLCTYKDDFESNYSKYSSRITSIRKNSISIPSSINWSGLETNYSASTSVNENLNISPEAFVETGRSRSLIRLYSWTAGFTPTDKIRSMVFSYSPSANKVFADCIFYSTGGYIGPTVDEGAGTYDTSVAPTDHYFFKDVLNTLDISTRISWSSDCPDNVSGCPGYTP